MFGLGFISGFTVFCLIVFVLRGWLPFSLRVSWWLLQDHQLRPMSTQHFTNVLTETMRLVEYTRKSGALSHPRRVRARSVIATRVEGILRGMASMVPKVGK